jgi:hypothetical protein
MRHGISEIERKLNPMKQTLTEKRGIYEHLQMRQVLLLALKI